MVRREPMYFNSRMTRTPRKVLATRTKRMTRKLLLFISLDRCRGITTGNTRRENGPAGSAACYVAVGVAAALAADFGDGVVLLLLVLATSIASSALVVVPQVVPLAVLALAVPLIVLETCKLH